MKQKFLLFGIIICLFYQKKVISQSIYSGSTEILISKIKNLESRKDPKCYATANRLEDFMYGTPLSPEARNLKIEILKEVSLFIKNQANQKALELGLDSIGRDQILEVADSLTTAGKLEDGDFFVKTNTQYLRIKAIDFKQYSSVAYSYRALLGLEIDLLFSDANSILPLTEEAVEILNTYLNLTSIAALQVADATARQIGDRVIRPEIIKEGWQKVLSGPIHQALFSFDYPQLQQTESDAAHKILDRIIDQKLASYESYNKLSTTLFLRNIQVFFAKQKWPTEIEESNELKNYLLESLVAFCSELVKLSDQYASQRNDVQIRSVDVQNALYQFLPHELNAFEDVVYFPRDPENKITIEAFDLDAFRDGGIHWKILDYALEEIGDTLKPIDPNAAEIVVEGVAQLGVLVLRKAGQYSHENEREYLVLDDLYQGFKIVQELISTYPALLEKQKENNPILSAKNDSEDVKGQTFSDVTADAQISFHQKSSNWLSRLIRSYVTSEEEGTIKIAIPPAFGGSGVATEDINNDHYIDLLLTGGAGNKLYLNNGAGAFIDVTDSARLNVWNDSLQSYGEIRQPLIADLDNDGWQDIVMIYVNQAHRVYRNIQGTKFEDVSHKSNLGGPGHVAGPATVLDYDNDGLLDIFIGYFGNYLQGNLPTLSRNNQNGEANRLYRNMGDFEFEEVHFTDDVATNTGWTQAVGHSDINQDGRQDLIVGNDFGVNHYYLNTPDHAFVDMSKKWGTDKPSYTMNVGIGDLNRDLYPDFYISNIVVMQKEEKYVSPNEQTTMKFDPEKMPLIRTVEANDLFLSRISDNQFQQFDLSDAIGRGYSATGWSWDADFFDYDNDGDEDLYCLNGMNDFQVYSTENEYYYPSEEESKSIQYAQSNREENVFFVNNKGVLENRAADLGTNLLSNSRSASYFDYDNDGDLDIIVNNYHDDAVLLQNGINNENHWLKVRLVGDPEYGVNKDAIGTSLIVHSDAYGPLWREVHSTTGYLSVHPKCQHFGLGKDLSAKLEVRWSNGHIVTLDDLQVNKQYTITYPDQIQMID